MHRLASRAFLTFMCLLILSSLVGLQGVRAQSRVVEIDRVIAIVNDDVIVRSELETQMRLFQAQFRGREQELPAADVVAGNILERLILERLQIQVGERLGMTVSDDELNQAIASIARRNKLGLAEFRDTLERDGYPFPEFRENIRKEMLIARVRQRQVTNRIRVRDREIDNFLNSAQGVGQAEYRLSHILIALGSEADAAEIQAREQQAQSLLEDIKGGEDFARLAALVSDGNSASAGGDLGWRKAIDIPAEFRDAATALSVGEVSELIRGPQGFHILRLRDRRGAGATTGGGEQVTQTKAQHILVRTNEIVSDADARNRLEQLRERIIQGTPIGDLARAHSEDRGSAIRDGDLGWVNPGDVVPEFEAVMNSLEPGEVSEPFESSFGWHVVQVEARRQYDNSDQASRSQARDAILKRKNDEELRTWLGQLRDEAFVEYRLDE